ncbi:MAG: F0F1 ATP synthase subunit gamma [Gammaproteobacteria bacterium]|nr:F0F1 ATP synthase subunit gamma [Gammaproteobacteria bacterium]MXX94295.1 F0F1 ATP synthase subunit gamma [Gammaproteobacteria bacterium]MYF52878.1 F0F1 ATP synthase subunit gamma [Gammaproteobacteria bacterium]MYK42561.1 F0F1 ATP synthase subunit gamma [Gammaproteobacteria bacterium]
MAAGREIKKKIGSIANIRKVTSAMQMVAASKMRRTQERMRQTRPYAQKIRAIIGHLAQGNPEYSNQFMNEPDSVANIGYVVISTDKGQCGGLNANLFRVLLHEMQEQRDRSVDSQLALIGNKAATFFSSVGGNVIAAVHDIGELPELKELIGSIKVVLDQFVQGAVQRVNVVTNTFVNSMTQRPVIRQLLPLTKTDDLTSQYWDYIYEPEANLLIDGLIQRYIESQIYQAVIENVACEQSARMIAMKNATDNADNMIDELNLLYNNVRQASITQEIAEIVGGAAAT